MQTVYRYHIQDYRGNEGEVMIRGPFTGFDDWADYRQTMRQTRRQLQDILLGRIVREEFGYQFDLPIVPIDANATNHLILCISYTDGNNQKKQVTVPSPDLSVIQFISGDLVDLTEPQTAQFIARLQSEHIDLANGTSITVDTAVVTGEDF